MDLWRDNHGDVCSRRKTWSDSLRTTILMKLTRYSQILTSTICLQRKKSFPTKPVLYLDFNWPESALMQQSCPNSTSTPTLWICNMSDNSLEVVFYLLVDDGNMYFKEPHCSCMQTQMVPNKVSSCVSLVPYLFHRSRWWCEMKLDTFALVKSEHSS